MCGCAGVMSGVGMSKAPGDGEEETQSVALGFTQQ